MSDTYLTKFNGEIDLSSIFDKEMTYTRLEAVIEKKFGEAVSLDRSADILYISGNIDDSEEIVEKMALLLSSVLIIDEEVIIEAQGEDPKDHWDIVLKADGVYIQDYKLVQGGISKYIIGG